jgi:hypothetical protein
MKFEPLKNKKEKMKEDILKSSNNKINDKSEFYYGYRKGIDNSFEVFANFIELFNKYKNNVKLLMNEQNEIWKKFVKFYESQTNLDKSNYLSKYNSWLFEFLFDDPNNLKSDDFLSIFE